MFCFKDIYFYVLLIFECNWELTVFQPSFSRNFIALKIEQISFQDKNSALGKFVKFTILCKIMKNPLQSI